ncbi:MAG: hypothetical protein IJL95_07320 [Solobacterium sp.]|nr:hypothetical protein [Solobacterium sp.]
MKKQWLTIILAVLLTGCTTTAGVDLKSRLDMKTDAVQAEKILRANYNGVYYSYYIDPGIGRIYADGTGNIFMLNGRQFVMNLNIPSIINRQYYRDQIRQYAIISGMPEVLVKNGSYADANDHQHAYTMSVYQTDKMYMTVFESETVTFHSVCREDEAADILAEMLRIARGVTIKTGAVLEAFSNRQVISYSRKRLELFQNIAPDNGAIDELFTTTLSYPDGEGGVISEDNYATDNFPDGGGDSGSDDGDTPVEDILEE